MRSLQLRIFLIVILAGLVSSINMRVGIIQDYEQRAVNLRISDVQNQFKILADHLLSYGYMQDYSSPVVNAELEQLSGLYDGRVLVIDKNFRVIRDTYGLSEGKYIISQEVIRSFKGETINNYDRVHGYIEITTPISFRQPGDEEDQIEGVMLASVSTDYIAATLEVLKKKSALYGLVSMLGIMAIALVMSKILTLPFARVSDAINRVRSGFSDEKIEVNDYLETEHIVDAFNHMRANMKTLDDSRQEFVANVSHELKTPLTSMKVLADALNSQPDAPVELYREFMGDITAEIERENSIINDLLSLVKLDKTEARMNIEARDIDELMNLVLKRLAPIAAQKDVEIVYEIHREIIAEVDEVKLTLAFSNLVENAIKYNIEGGRVSVSLDADYKHFVLKVEDTGIGIDEDSIPHIFERFYRADKSHSRALGGTGLGLAITRNVILLHKGFVEVSSEPGRGTAFTVRIPLTYQA